ncbi:uncharacterized protein LOC120779874 [Bactrocera tryoni]|uniref:uncharacterized protein LOC120779874 n=1 Tax=Bactrocera tryoni TaxID=59916 RepID=UPI001A974E2F|nr:uncharacterized protein LOC120779874 [Bactrocera tryoni]
MNTSLHCPPNSSKYELEDNAKNTQQRQHNSEAPNETKRHNQTNHHSERNGHRRQNQQQQHQQTLQQQHQQLEQTYSSSISSDNNNSSSNRTKGLNAGVKNHISFYFIWHTGKYIVDHPDKGYLFDQNVVVISEDVLHIAEWARVLQNAETRVKFDDYIHVDDELVITGSLNDDEILGFENIDDEN